MTSRRRGGADAGFTLIELLIVIVIVPLIIAAIAEAIIVSLQNDAGVSNRLSDSVNAQLTSAYFVRDVQGASLITTNQALYNNPGGYNTSYPQVCGPASSPGQLLVALFHVATASSPVLDTGYWLQGSGASAQVVRYSCTIGATGATASTTSVVVADTPAGVGTAVQAQTDITPAQFASAATGGWALVTAATQATGPISGGVISVDSTGGFVSGPVTVATSLGPQTVSCTLQPSPPAFTGCGALAGGIGGGSLITQSAISYPSNGVSPNPAATFGVGTTDVNAVAALMKTDTTVTPNVGPWLKTSPYSQDHYQIVVPPDGSGTVSVYSAAAAPTSTSDTGLNGGSVIPATATNTAADCATVK
ncbi:MAG: prepilin-type N-terminal cleavage/methylation domain-containing protein [Acidimicrobiales bacterium]